MHQFPGINACPQRRHLPALKPNLLGRDKVVNAGWQAEIRSNGRRGASPASPAAVPKQTFFFFSSLNPQLCPCYLLLPHRALCCLVALASSPRACEHQTLPPVLSSHIPSTETTTCGTELAAPSCQNLRAKPATHNEPAPSSLAVPVLGRA